MVALQELRTFLLARRDLAPTTTRKTIGSLRALERAGVDLDKPSRSAYDRFLATKKELGEDGPGLRHYGRALRHLLAFHGTSWPDFRLPRAPTSPRRLLPDDVVRQLVAYHVGRDDQDDVAIATARFCFQLGAYVGIRWPSEAHELKLSDFNEATGELTTRSAKVRKTRVLQLEPWLAELVKIYVHGARDDVVRATSTWRTSRSSSLILHPGTGLSFTREGLRMFTWRHGRTVDEDLSCGQLRTWCAVYRLLGSNFDVWYVRDFLGHEKLSSTEHYIARARALQRQRAASSQISPLTDR